MKDYLEVTDSLIDDIMDQLSEYDPYIHKQSQESAYIHFGELPNGLTHKLRVSTHEERARYGYKWQLRLDGVPVEADRKQHSKYFDNVESLVKAFRTYYTKVSENKSNGSVSREGTSDTNRGNNGNIWD